MGRDQSHIDADVEQRCRNESMSMSYDDSYVSMLNGFPVHWMADHD